MNIELLDILLNVFYETDEEVIIPFNLKGFSHPEIFANYETRDIYIGIEALHDDGYIYAPAGNRNNTFDPEHGAFCINTEGRRFKESGGYANKEALNKVEQLNESVRISVLHLTHQELVDRIIDYPKVKRQRNIAFGVSIFLAILSALTFVISLKYKGQ